MQKNEPEKAGRIPRISNRLFLVIMSVVVFAVILDAEVGLVADFIPDTLTTSLGINLFVALAGVFIAGQYLALEFIKQKNRGNKNRARHLQITDRSVRLAQYTLSAVFVFIILQIVLTSQYNSTLIMTSTLISYGLLVTMFAMLSRGFLSWYKFSSRRNIMILIFASAMISMLAYAVAQLTLFIGMLQEQPQTVTAEHVAFFPTFEPGTFFGEVQTWFEIASGAGFILTWVGITMLLYPYAKRFGKVKFWAVMGTALFYHTIQIPLFMLGWYSPSENSDAMTNILTITLIGVYAGVIFGAAFLLVARAVPKGSFPRDHMIIAAYGFLLLFVAGTGTASQAAYPPFGLAAVSFVGLASYMIYNGLYTSAISVSENARLRVSIKNSAKEQAKLLDSIGSAEMEKELHGRVLKITKKHSESMVEETGIEPSMTEEEIKNYVDTVIKEYRTEA